MDFKSYFDIPSSITYLNTAGNGVLPQSHHQWRRVRESDFFALESNLRDEQGAFINSIKVNFSALFNCCIDNLFLVPCFSFGYNVLLDGLDRNLRFTLLEEDYPSLNYPVISRGFAYDILPFSADIEDAIYQHIKQTSPDVLALSIVNYINGLKVDLDFIKKLKKDFPKLLIIGDATQFMGTAPFDFEDSGFDTVAGSGYKWMMAGFGNGYMMISKQLSSRLYQDAYDKPRAKEAWWQDKSVLNIYFEPGHQDTLSQGTLNQSVLLFNKIGLDHVKSYLDELMAYAYRIFEDRNWLLPMIAKRTVRSSLINLQIDPSLYPHLLANGIKCYPRGTGIRIGLHLYNTKADINRLVDVIDRLQDEFKNR